MDRRFVPGSDTNRMVMNHSARPFDEAVAARRATNTRPMMVDDDGDRDGPSDGHEAVLGKPYATPTRAVDAFGDSVLAESNADIVSRAGGRLVRG